MRRNLALVPLVVMTVLAFGCGRGSSSLVDGAQPTPQQDEVPPNVFPAHAATLLRSAETLEVLSLRPVEDSDDPKAFHQWPVLGTVIVEGADRTALVDTIIAGVAPADSAVALCFYPRHGIHAVTQKGTVDLVICFECNQVRVHYSEGGEDYYMPDYSLAKPLSEVLVKAGIPISPSFSELMEQGWFERRPR